MRKRAVVTSMVTASALTIGALTAAGTAGAAPSSKAVPNSVPKWQTHARHLGKTNNSAAVDVRVYLQPNGGTDALKAFVDSLSTPGTASYGHVLTAAQYHQRFDPTAAQVNSVRQWLTAAGLKVTSVNVADSYLRVAGTVAQAQAAFGTSIDNYAHDGQTVRANASAVQVPANVAGFVSGVTGLDTTVVKARPNTAGAPVAFVNARPCSIFYGQLSAKYEADYRTPLPTFAGQYVPYAPCGYTGPQFRAAYEGTSTLTGAGATVAITDAYASPYNFSDADHYARINGDGAYRPGQYVERNAKTFTNQTLCDPEGWSGEEVLDTEAVHAMAPDANIRYYGAASCLDTDFLDTLARVVNDNKAQIVTNSWGDLGEGVDASEVAGYHRVFLQGAAQGISFLFSSGDNGDELAATAIRQADFPASDPDVTAVGGTSTGIGAAGNIVLQTGWGTHKFALSASGKSWNPLGFLYGAGGGFSALFNRPSYQNGVVHSVRPGRAVPDVAMDADPTTGMLVGQTQQFPTGVHYGQYRIGGTSLASPLFAGMTALKIQAAGKRLGFLNPTIYTNLGSFTDVKGKPKDPGNVRVDYANGVNAAGGLVYSVRTFNQDSSLAVVNGWDDVTGVGVPNTNWFKP